MLLFTQLYANFRHWVAWNKPAKAEAVPAYDVLQAVEAKLAAIRKEPTAKTDGNG